MQPPITPMRWALDTESTGLTDADRIVSIAVYNEHHRVEYVVDPGIPSHPKAAEVHGITDEKAKRGRPAWWALGQILALIPRDSIIYAHNAKFDRRMIAQTLTGQVGKGAGEMWGGYEWRCTCELAREVLPRLRNHRLDTVADHFGLRRPAGAHHALEDAQLCWDVAQRLEHLKEKGGAA